MLNLPDHDMTAEIKAWGAETADNWQALEQTLAVFRQAAIEVGERLGYAYPEELHERVWRYVEEIRRLGRGG